MSSDGDRTARARIRDAAIALFTERGIATSTVRDIAQLAGVSSGLLRHHFGSKEGLREACDEYAMARLAELREQMLSGSATMDESIIGTIHPVASRLQAYLIRSIVEGSSTAMFDRMVEAGEAWLATRPIRTADPHAWSAVLVAMQMGMFLLRDQLSHALGEDVSRPPGQARMLRACVEILSQPLLTPDQAELALATLDRLITGKDNP